MPDKKTNRSEKMSVKCKKTPLQRKPHNGVYGNYMDGSTALTDPDAYIAIIPGCFDMLSNP